MMTSAKLVQTERKHFVFYSSSLKKKEKKKRLMDGSYVV